MKRRLSFGMVLVLLATVGLFSVGCSNGGSKQDIGDLDLVEVEDGDTETDVEEAETESDLACKEEVTYPTVLEFGAVMSSVTNSKNVLVYASPSHLIKRALIVNDDATPQEFSFVTSAALPCADATAENCHRIEIGKAANSVEPLQFAILYTPKDGALPDTAELEIETDDPCVPTKRIPLSSSCKGAYTLSVTVDGQAVSATNLLTFGPVMPANPVNPSAPKVIKLSNTGVEGNNASVFVRLSFDNTFSDNFEFSGTGCTLTDLTTGFVLGIGDSRTCSLIFKGRAIPGDYTSQVTVNWNSTCSAATGSPSSPITLPLTGSVAQCQIIVDPNPKLDFGDVVIGERVRDHLTITNDCPYKMLWSGCSLATGTQFSTECPVGGLLLDSKSSKELAVSVKPTATDWQQDTLILNFSLEDGSNAQTVTRYLVAKVTPCTTPTCCPPDSAGCAPGFTRCGADNGLELCNSSCNWIAATPCAAPMICKEGVCVPPICIDGQTKCAGSAILECTNNSWPIKQECNDNNPCTVDSCSQSTSTATCLSTKAADGTACDDELSATSGTVCTNGVCGLPACVNDGVCCIDSQPTNENGACPDDNNPCTEDACKAGVCTHPNSANTKECRPVAGSCDVPELCDGQGHCPDDQFKPDTERCGLSNGSVCDTDDYCTGFGAECINQKSTDICRAPVDDCDYVEMCDGTHDTCPADRTMDDASPCGTDKKNQCLAGHCVDCVDDSGCADLADDGNECTAPACNTTTHTCYQKPLAVGHACGDATVTVCDRADTCNDAGVCQANHEPNTKLCRASDGECDVAESCDGQGKCPDDGFKPNTTPCRSSNGPCDLAESCTGTSATCPLDSKSTASCRAAVGDCDLPATCDGVHDSCPENAKKTDGTSCGQDGSDQCVGGSCVDCLNDSGCQDLAWGLRDEACSKRSCGSNHLCAFSDNNDGTTCGVGGKDQCLGGACKDCVDVSGCAEISLGNRDDECASKACEGNYCVFATKPAGTACSMLGTGTGDQCDDVGVCQDCVDLAGCADLPDDVNSCTDKACVQNVCQNQNDNTNACSLNTGCTTDACQDGACEPQTISSGCFIDGVCIGNGAKKGLTGDDSCKVCDHASPNGWTTHVAGESCDDGNPCNGVSTCQTDGSCVQTTEPVACSEHGTCNSETGNCACNAGYTGASCGQCAPGYGCYPNCINTFSCSEGICRDPITCLEWQQQTPMDPLPLTDADNYCQNLDLLGTGWRLPNVSELRALVRNCGPIETTGGCGVKDTCSSCGVSQADRCLGGECGWACDPQPNVCPDNGGLTGCYWPQQLSGRCYNYWSSSLSPEGMAWTINFLLGLVHADGTNFLNSVRCVRENTCVPSCSDKPCGSDGCGGYCGTCSDNLSCNSEGQCTQAGLTWKPIPSGAFMMGCTPQDTQCLGSESPQHRVNVPAFEMTEAEITREQYFKVMGNYSSCQHSCVGNCPAECMDWNAAKAFCEAVGGRLPSEAEWEYAARAGTETIYYCGNDTECVENIAWYYLNSNSHTYPVKTKAPNAFALYDMLGNVSEWTADCFHENYANAPNDGRAWEGGDCLYRMTRGGSYSPRDYGIGGSFRVRSSYRRKEIASKYYYEDVGFRCVRDVPIVNDCSGQAAHTRCNDNNPCTDNDECDGTGSCSGIANGWCWFDPATKLIWQNPPSENQYLINEGPDFCNNLELGGITVWKLPSIDELRSIVSGCARFEAGGACQISSTNVLYSTWYNTCQPACPRNSDVPPFQFYWREGLVGSTCDNNGACGGVYWSSTRFGFDAGYTDWGGYLVDFSSGAVTSESHYSSKNVRCVSACIPFCISKQCGPDNCGGTCGACSSNETCNSSGQCEATIPPEPAHEIILKDTAVVVPEEVAATVDTPACGTMRFPFENGQPPFAVVPGSTIVSGLGTGFLCRVLTVTTQGSELVLTTEAGTLSDVIESGTLQFKVPLAIADAPGKRKSLTASLTLPSRTLYDNHGLTVTLRPGSLTFQPDLNVRADYGLTEGPYFLATVSGTMTADAGIDMELGATASIDGQVTVYEQSFPFYFQAGPLPVAGRVIVSVKPGFSASASGTLSSSYGARSTRTVTAGAEYSDHQWRSVNVTNQSTVERYGPNVDASVGLQAEVKVDVQSELLLYEAASANILVAPRVEGDLTPHANWSYDWDLNACVWGGIGADIEIFHHALVSYDKTLFNRCWDLWNGPGCINQCATKNLYCSTPGTVEGCGEMDDGDNCLDIYYKECAANQTCKNGACVGECTSGACCNTTTQSYKAAGALCKTDYQYICKLGSACGGTVTRQKQTQTCTGTSADCKGPLSAWADDSTITCASDQKCLAGQFSCASCTTDGCTSGPCCDTASTPKTVRSASYVCEPNSAYEYSCPDGTGAGSDVYIRFRDRYCPGGQETSCTGSLGALKSEEVFAYCGNSEHCNAATGTCDPNGCASNNWCQTNNHGSGSYCSASNTVTTCRTSNGCFEVANTTTCSPGQGCANGSCTDSCSSICSGYCGTYVGCNCGSCSSGEVCSPDHLCYDCAGARKCDVFINSTEAEIFRGNTESNTVGACTTISTPGWHNGPTVNNINLRWTWVTGCTPPPDGGNLTNYAGDNARYNFYVPVEGYYTIKVKIPAVGYLCANQQNTRHADDVYYGLIRPLEQGRVFGPFATSQFKGQWMPLTATPLHLYAGDQTLILYDHGSTGSGCIGTGSRWVFVDSVEVKWDH